MADTKQTKTIGEHFVAAEMARRGWAPAFTRDGLERTDILAVQTGGDRRMVEVQVKTARGPSFTTVNWPLGTKAQQPSRHPREYFVLVAVLNGTDVAPRYFIVPRDHLAAAAWINHFRWLTAPGIPEGRRNTGVENSRVHVAPFARYEDRWDLLDQDSPPVLLPSSFRESALADGIRLPPGHAWHQALPKWSIEPTKDTGCE